MDRASQESLIFSIPSLNSLKDNPKLGASSSKKSSDEKKIVPTILVPIINPLLLTFLNGFLSVFCRSLLCNQPTG